MPTRQAEWALAPTRGRPAAHSGPPRRRRLDATKPAGPIGSVLQTRVGQVSDDDRDDARRGAHPEGDSSVGMTARHERQNQPDRRERSDGVTGALCDAEPAPVEGAMTPPDSTPPKTYTPNCDVTRHSGGPENARLLIDRVNKSCRDASAVRLGSASLRWSATVRLSAVRHVPSREDDRRQNRRAAGSRRRPRAAIA